MTITSESTRAVEKGSDTSGKRNQIKVIECLKALHMIYFSMFFISIDISLHIKAYLYKPQSIAGNSRNHRYRFTV